MPDKYRRYIPLGISAGLHLIVLIVMMLYYLPLMQEQPWYEVSWSQMSEIDMVEEDASEPEFSDIQVNLAQPKANTKEPKQATPPAKPNPTN
ncbi:MAG: cell envelope integrity protein TolA, partial [Candidatus Cloacimonetes bacterium]|nr:cell envelope integrity protein TolA [Candidatus Cloacimonadota bacterium]